MTMEPERRIAGVYAAAITPRGDHGEVNTPAMFDLVDFLAAAGVDGIVLLGSTGEFTHLSEEERVRLVDCVVKRSRLPILAGVGHPTLSGALSLAQAAVQAGAAGVLVMPPYFFRYGQEEIREFYLQFAAKLGKGPRIFLYNIPAFTNEITGETAAALLSTGLFAGIKDSSGDYDLFTRLRSVADEKPFTLLVGHDRIFTRSRLAGAHGIISGLSCAAPELLVTLDRAIRKNLKEEAGRLDRHLHEFLKWHDCFPTPVAIKTAVSLRGIDAGPLAVPLGKARERRLAEFREWFPSWLAGVQTEAALVA